MGIDAATTYQNDRVVALFRAKKEGQPLPWMKGEWPFRGGGSVPAALHLTVEPSLYLRTSPIHLVPQKGLEPDTSSPLGCPRVSPSLTSQSHLPPKLQALRHRRALCRLQDPRLSLVVGLLTDRTFKNRPTPSPSPSARAMTRRRTHWKAPCHFFVEYPSPSYGPRLPGPSLSLTCPHASGPKAPSCIVMVLQRWSDQWWPASPLTHTQAARYRTVRSHSIPPRHRDASRQ